MSDKELFKLADKVTRRLLKRYAPHLADEDREQLETFGNQCRTFAAQERRAGR